MSNNFPINKSKSSHTLQKRRNPAQHFHNLLTGYLHYTFIIHGLLWGTEEHSSTWGCQQGHSLDHPSPGPGIPAGQPHYRKVERWRAGGGPAACAMYEELLWLVQHLLMIDRRLMSPLWNWMFPSNIHASIYELYLVTATQNKVLLPEQIWIHPLLFLITTLMSNIICPWKISLDNELC